jgi:hypothetical protein
MSGCRARGISRSYHRAKPKHGSYTIEAINRRRALRLLMSTSWKTLAGI